MYYIVIAVVIQSLSHVQLFLNPWTAACQASSPITNSYSLFKLMFINSVMPSNHLILCCPFLLPFLATPSKQKKIIPATFCFQTVHEGLDFKTRITRNRFKLKKELRPRLPKKGYCWDTQPFFLSSKRGADFFFFFSFFLQRMASSLISEGLGKELSAQAYKLGQANYFPEFSFKTGF